MKKKIVIVGGGITGLSAAYYLQKQVEVNQLPMEITLLEQSSELGGKMSTIHQNGYTIEQGADSFLARKEPGMKLMEELGLKDQLVRNSTGQAYVLVENKLHQIPAGSFMGIPIDETPFLASHLVSENGQKRVLEETSIPRGEEASDQSLGAFLRRRFGDELVEHLLEPLLSGIYSSDIDQMSIMSTFPNFYELEQTYGSLLEGLRKTMLTRKAGTGKKPGQFVSLQNGLKGIIDELLQAIGKETIQIEKQVERISPKEKGYALQLTDGKLYEADLVLLTIPHREVPTLFAEQDLFQSLNHIPVSSVANVVLAFDAKAIKEDLEGTGFVVSRNSDFRITACTWTHRKWPHTTPDGKVMFRLYVGKPSDQEIVTLSDEDIISIVLQDLNKVMDIEGDPEFSVVTRWQNKMPQYTVGHQKIVAQVREQMKKELPGIFLAGSSYDGVGIPDCIGSAETAVQQAIEIIQK